MLLRDTEAAEGYRKQAAEGKKWCYDCSNYYTSYFCGYNSSNCRIHGSLDMDQHERHPDESADSCADYHRSDMPSWYERDIQIDISVFITGTKEQQIIALEKFGWELYALVATKLYRTSNFNVRDSENLKFYTSVDDDIHYHFTAMLVDANESEMEPRTDDFDDHIIGVSIGKDAPIAAWASMKEVLKIVKQIRYNDKELWTKDLTRASKGDEADVQS